MFKGKAPAYPHREAPQGAPLGLASSSWLSMEKRHLLLMLPPSLMFKGKAGSVPL